MLRKDWTFWVNSSLAWLIAIIIPVSSLWWFLAPQLIEPHINRLRELAGRTGSIAALGLAFTVISGALTLYRFWYFHERNLPKRLQDYISRRRQASAQFRNQRLDRLQIQQAKWDSVYETLTVDQRHRRLFEFVSHLDAQATNPDSALAKATERQKTAALHQSLTQFETGTFHFERALKYATALNRGYDSDGTQAKLISELELAAACDPSDVRIFKHLLEHVKQGQKPEKIPMALHGWISSAQISLLPREEAEARIAHGKYWYSRTFDPSIPAGTRQSRRVLVRSELTQATQLILNSTEPNRSSKSDELLGDAFDTLGDVRRDLRTIGLAASCYRAAIDIFSNLGNGTRASAIQNKLDQLQTGAEKPVAESPHTAVVRCHKDLGDAFFADENQRGAIVAFKRARVSMRRLKVPTDLNQEAYDNLQSEIDEALKLLTEDADSSKSPSQGSDVAEDE